MNFKNIDNLKDQDINLIYSKYREDFLKLYAAEQCKKHTIKDLVPSFISSEPCQYYNYAEDTALPIVRLSKLIEYDMYLNAGLSGVEIDKIFDQIDEAVMDGLKHNKGAAKIGFLTTEGRKRRGMVIPLDLLCNYIAIQNVREDEDPTTVNPAIQLQKAEAIKNEIAKGNSYFFFQAPELKRLIKSLGTTMEELMQRVQESEVKTEALNEMFNLWKLQRESLIKE